MTLTHWNAQLQAARFVQWWGKRDEGLDEAFTVWAESKGFSEADRETIREHVETLTEQE